MRILIISHYYSPEIGAPVNRMVSFIDAMKRKGYQINIICGFPNYPGGVLSNKDKGKLYRIEHIQDVTIIRTYVFCSPHYGALNRIINQISFAISSFIAGLILPKHDVVVSSVPPLFHAFGAMIISKIKRSKFVLDIRDLWCDSAKALNALKDPRMLKILYSIESKLIKHSDFIFTVSKGMEKTIKDRGGAGRINIIYNGASDDILLWKNEANSIRQKYGWESKFIICYAGIIGIGQKLNNLIELIPDLELKNTIFLIIGEGMEKDPLKSKVQLMGLNNVIVMDKMYRSEVIPYIYASDLMMVLLDEIDLFRCTIPSKVFDYMAAGKPVITNVNGELKEIIEHNNTGIYFTFKDKNMLFKSLNKLYSDKQLREQMGNNGKLLVFKQFRRAELADKAIELIETLNNDVKTQTSRL